MACHHIVQESDGGSNGIENCVPLCFDCHSDILSPDSNRPKGTKYQEDELKLHRDRWFAKVNGTMPAAYGEEHRNADRRLLENILKVLPWEGSMHFLSTNSFAGYSFDLRRLNHLEEFGFRCEDPMWEFIDSTLETMRAELAANVENIRDLIALNPMPTHREYRASVPPESEAENLDRFEALVAAIHEAAQKCVGSYKKFVREGRHRLAVSVAD